ncbi:hypothetical protein COO60DRAFT_1461120 [Scenedesmus sp. NREL 46B-D3]|nr:hypothetical protein COO60DRAFT_1461120 [Scenedesmus sp. NREL 46B-D3]
MLSILQPFCCDQADSEQGQFPALDELLGSLHSQTLTVMRSGSCLQWMWRLPQSSSLTHCTATRQACEARCLAGLLQERVEVLHLLHACFCSCGRLSAPCYVVVALQSEDACSTDNQAAACCAHPAQQELSSGGHSHNCSKSQETADGDEREVASAFKSAHQAAPQEARRPPRPLLDLSSSSPSKISFCNKKRPAARMAPAPTTGHSCSQCGATSTPVWRAGPAGPKTLCNACGVRYMKTSKRKGAAVIIKDFDPVSGSLQWPGGGYNTKVAACLVYSTSPAGCKPQLLWDPWMCQAEGDTKTYETTIAVVNEPKGMLAPDPGNAAPLDAHHKMLHEGSILSSHFKAYQAAITKYTTSASKFMHAADDFLLSAGQPAKYEHKLTAEGQAAVAAAAAGRAPAAAPAGADEAAEAAAVPSAFVADATQPSTLPLQGPVAGYYICPSMPGSPALGAADLTHTAPADILLPRQHEALFRHDVQRKLVAGGSAALTAALQEKLAPAFKVWLRVCDECKQPCARSVDSCVPAVVLHCCRTLCCQVWLEVYEECKLLAEVERLRRDADAALHRLHDAKKKVLEAEASAPLVSGEQLRDAGQMPRVLVQGTAGGLVATPAAQQRQEMYQKEVEYTDASLAFELAEKVLRDKLGWLMQAGAGLKGTAAAALGHALVAAAAEGQPGQAADGTAAAGGSLRAPREELLEPFPAHVLARLSGQHLPTLQQLVLADAARLARWGGLQDLERTESDPPVQQAGVTAEKATTAGTTAGTGSPGAAAAATAGSAAGSAGGAAAPVASAGLAGELQQAAAAADVPLDLLAAAVAADVRERDAVEAAAGRDDAAWHLLHDASVVAAKEEAVLLPAVRERPAACCCWFLFVNLVLPQHLGRDAAERLKGQHQALAAALARLGKQSPAAAAFDLALVEVLDWWMSMCSCARSRTLQSSTGAPQQQHPRGPMAGSWGHLTPQQRLKRRVEVQAGAEEGAGCSCQGGVGAIDAAADVARFGRGHVPYKL